MTKIAIDGTAGSGKSTVAALAAKRLGVRHVDTGAMYRAVTLMALRQGVGPGDGDGLGKLAREMDLTLEGSRVALDGEDISLAIRGDDVDEIVSQVAAHPQVRSVLVELQREMARDGVVMEGRDIGTVVLPEADVKVYLEARSEVRASRRGKDKGSDDGAVVADGLARRDELDSGRSVSPLRPAPGALVIDTSDLTAEEVVDKIVAAVDR